MKFYGDGSQYTALIDAEGYMTIRPYHAGTWLTVWLYQRDAAEADRVEEALWKRRLDQMGMLREFLD